MIGVDALVVGIVDTLAYGLVNLARDAMGPGGLDVGDGDAFAVLEIGALDLVGSDSSSPEKAARHPLCALDGNGSRGDDCRPSGLEGNVRGCGRLHGKPPR